MEQEYDKNNTLVTRNEEGSRICNIEGCNKKHQSKGYCCGHYSQVMRSGKLKSTRITHDCTNQLCEICGSNKKVQYNEKTNKFLCGRHREQVYLKGDTYRTPYDGNDFNKNEINNTLEIVMYNGEEIHKSYCDLNMADRVMKYVWYYDYTKGYATSRINGKLYTTSKFLTGWECIPDHINRNTLDDRMENLRPADRSTNAMNSKISSLNTSGTKGVSWITRISKWNSCIKFKGKTIGLGHYINKEEAIEVREKAELKYFGEFSSRFDELKEKYKAYYEELLENNLVKYINL